jgi:hypothetical protein
VLTRDDATDIVRGYVNGVEAWNFVDSTGAAVFSGPNQIMRFFQDDNVSGQAEARGGFLDHIRIHNHVLTGAQVAALETAPTLNPPPYDQRGMPFARQVDGDGVAGARIDMGAYELQGIANFSPVFTSPDVSSVLENTTAVMTVTATDADLPSQTITYSIVGGVDQSKFAITSVGALSFLSPPNFENPTDANVDNVYVVTVEASDGLGGTATQTIDVTVLPVNEHSPVFTSTDTASVPENTTAVKTVTATDADLPAQAITFSIVGGADQSKFGITSNGVLSFLLPPDFDEPTDANSDNIYIVTVQASDGAGGAAMQTIGVTVTGSPADYGDAPDASAGAGPGNYNTRGIDNGPSHEIVPGIRMGATVDGDSGMLHNTAANADDVNGALPDDEDGLVNPLADLLLTVGAEPTVNVRVTNTSGSAATLYGWIDYNGNGVFENTTERASVPVPSSPTSSVVTLVFPAVPGGFTGTTYARFRLSTNAAAANPTGSAGDGEVEDYRVTITRPSDGITEATKTKQIASGLNGGPALANGDMFGSAAASIGDLDGDGITDLAVGAPSQFGSGTPGEVRVLFMNANGTVKTSQRIASGIGGGPTLAAGDYFGHGTASIGDLDGDGVTDLVVGATKDDTGGYNAGAAYVLLMNPNGTVKAHQKIASGIGGGPTLVGDDRFGIAMTSLGDLNGDGVIDMAVAALGDDVGGSARGAVYVFFMNRDGTVQSRQKIASGTAGGPVLANLDVFGSSLAALGDIDGDGVTEVAVGASGDDTGGDSRGAVYILFLNSNGTAKSSRKIASGVGGGPILANGDRFSRSLSSLGDLDGDGVTDLAVGAYQDDTGGNGRGALHVLFLNSDGTAKSSRTIASGTGGGPTLANDDNFGAAVAALGDLDGDGVTELAVGAERDDTGGNGRGAAYVLFLKRANSNPVFTSPTAASVSENTTAVMTVTATDADVPAQAVTFSIVGGADQARLSISSSGALSFISPPDFEAPADAGGDHVYEVTVQAGDGNGGTAIQNISVTVTPINDNIPIFTSTDVVSVPENSTAVITVTAADADVPAQAVTFSIAGGADQSKFMIPSGGVLTFKTAPDFEQPTDANGDNLYIVIVQATDGGLSNLEAVLVTVTNVNELPGDYNLNGIVDTADYVVWRKGLSSGAHTPDDYNLWRANYGRALVIMPPGTGSVGAPAAPSTDDVAAGEAAFPAMPAAIDLAFLPAAASSQASSQRALDEAAVAPNANSSAEAQAADQLLLALASLHQTEAVVEADARPVGNEGDNATHILDSVFAALDSSNAARSGITGQWWNLRR